MRVPTAAAEQSQGSRPPRIALQLGMLTVTRQAVRSAEATLETALSHAVARALTVEIRLPVTAPRVARHNFSADVVVGSLSNADLMGDVRADEAGSGAASMPVMLPRADSIEWATGLGGLWLGRVSMRSAEGNVHAAQLHARKVCESLFAAQ